jgi:hypothetical protein
LPHAPQLLASVSVFLHDAPHCVSPVAQLAAQPVPPQTMPVVHVTPHAPQFIGSRADTVQSIAIIGQRNSPGLHAQALISHVSFGWHACVHVPQFVFDTRVSTSQPSVGS